MGAFLSSADGNCGITEYKEVSCGETSKRQKMLPNFHEENSRLIPSLPDEITIRIFARLPRICYFRMKLVAKNWKAAITSPELFNLRNELRVTEEWLYLLIKVEEDKFHWNALDPWSRKWQRLPPMPNIVYKEKSLNIFGPIINFSNVVRRWLGQKKVSDHLPLSGCGIGAVDGCLYVLGGFLGDAAVRHVWRYNPILNEWNMVSSMFTGRAHCKTGVLKNKLYVAGGVSRGQGGFTPLQSAEVFDPCSGTWSELPTMPFSKSEVLPSAFLADTLKPFATGLASYRGKLCVPQSLYSWPFFVDVGGEIYNPETNSWAEMPIGMGEGWPARQAGTKLSVVVDGELYAFDPSSSLNGGNIKVYDQKEDAWKVIIQKVPFCDLAESESPYLLAGFHGKLHFITKDLNHEISVLRADVWDGLGSFSSTSSSVVDSSLHERSHSMAESERVIWKLIAKRNFGSAELVSCQVLDI